MCPFIGMAPRRVPIVHILIFLAECNPLVFCASLPPLKIGNSAKRRVGSLIRLNCLTNVSDTTGEAIVQSVTQSQGSNMVQFETPNGLRGRQLVTKSPDTKFRNGSVGSVTNTYFLYVS
jgi:hypothetical protein